MSTESIQSIIDDEKLEIWTVSKISGQPEIKHNKHERISLIIGFILREMEPELRYELISDAMIDNEVELAPSICNSMIDNTGFHNQYIDYLVERVLWYLFNNDNYNTSGPGDDLSQSEQEAEWNAQANTDGVRHG